MYAKLKIFLMTVGFLLLLSCSERNRQGWTGFGEEADRINQQLDSINNRRGITIADTTLIYRLARSAENPQAKNFQALLSYWKACAIRSHNPDSAKILLGNAIQLCDSARMPYLNARIRLVQASVDAVPIPVRYVTLRNILDYSKSIGDTTMIRTAYHQLGLVYLEINELESFKDCIDNCERIYTQTANHSKAAKYRINYALYHIRKGETEAAIDIIRNLLNNPYIKGDSVFMGSLYMNIANLYNNPDSMARALEYSPKYRNDLSKRYTIEFSIAWLLNERGDTARCDSILDYLAPLIADYGDAEAKRKLYFIKSQRRKAVGDSRGALSALEASYRYADTITENERGNGSKSYIHRDELKRIELDYERRKLVNRTRWFVILFFCSLTVMSVIFWFWDKHRKSQLARTKAERDLAQTTLNLEREQRNVVAMKVAMTERDNLVKDVGKAIDEMSREGRISTDDKRSVSRMIKLSENTQQEYASFAETYGRVHPDFIKRLSERFPDLSEGDVRLALYISAGLSSAQIAQMLHIKPDSVKKNRQRLRRHMAIDASESLENTLRSLL